MNWKTMVSVFLLCVGVQSSAWAAEEMQAVTDPVKVFEAGYLQVVGVSEEGQTRYQALRAAQVVAQRDLLEVMQGLKLFGSTSVKDGMLQSDEIKTSVEGFLKGAVKCGQTYNESKGSGEVCMRLNIRGKGGLYDIILPLMKDDKLMPEKRPTFKPAAPALTPMVVDTATSGQAADTAQAQAQVPDSKAAPPKAEVKAPSELTNPHDGLIIDARDFQFRPALVNRVLTDKDDVVFEPSKILSNVLVERGCGGFTTDDGKAKALLESWGSKNPMVVKCTDVRKFTDAKISQDDAAAVYVNDQKSNLLAQARVVFILK
jgi:hypothetical protein